MFIMQNVLPRSGARAYTVSDDASADQRYFVDLQTVQVGLYFRRRQALCRAFTRLSNGSLGCRLHPNYSNVLENMISSSMYDTISSGVMI